MSRAHDLIIIRPAAEVSTKAHRTRQRFQAVLRRNVADALGRLEVPHRLHAHSGGLLLETGAVEDALGVLPRIFGIGSFSPVAATAKTDMEAMAAAAAAAFGGRIRGRTFAVRARKLGRFPFATMDIEREVGRRLDRFADVDLDRPDVTVHIELHRGTAFLFSERRPGAGGLPAGVQGRAVALLSGGFDSAVAAWRVMRRGVAVDFLFCNLGGGAYERMVLQVAKVLTEAWGHGRQPRFHVVDFAAPMKELQGRVPARYWQVVLKRMMYRAAARVAAETGADAIVTGESIGQVSSQTMKNLSAIDAAADLPVLRPLIGCDKREIMEEAQRIGTGVLSERIKEYCAIVPDHPVVAATRKRVDVEEEKLDPAVLAEAVAGRRQIGVRAVTATELRTPYLFTSEIPENAIVIDCQPRYMYQAWHVSNARHFDPMELMETYRWLDKDHTYVLYCTHGTQTPYLAELMQQSGYEAYAFRGGISSLRRYIEARGRSPQERV